jgi:hypothetical protein
LNLEWQHTLESPCHLSNSSSHSQKTPDSDREEGEWVFTIMLPASGNGSLLQSRFWTNGFLHWHGKIAANGHMEGLYSGTTSS